MLATLPSTDRALSALHRLGYSHPVIDEVAPTDATDEDISVGLIHERGEPPTGIRIWCTSNGRKQLVRITDMKTGAPATVMHSLLALLRETPSTTLAPTTAASDVVEPPAEAAPGWPETIRGEMAALMDRPDVLSVDRGRSFTPRNGGTDIRPVCLGRGYVIRNFPLPDGTVLQAHIIPNGIDAKRLAERLGMKPESITEPPSIPTPEIATTVAAPTATTTNQLAPPPRRQIRRRQRVDRPTTQRQHRATRPASGIKATYAWFRSVTRHSIVAWVPTRRLRTPAAKRLIARALVIPTITCDDQTMVIVLRCPVR